MSPPENLDGLSAAQLRELVMLLLGKVTALEQMVVEQRAEIARRILENRLSTLKTKGIDWPAAVAAGSGLSQAEFALAAEDAAKQALLADREVVTAEDLSSAIAERKATLRR